MNSKSQIIGIVYLLITAIIWGGSFISQLFGGAALGSYIFNTARCIFSSITCLIMLLFNNFKNENRFVFITPGTNLKKMLINSFLCAVTLFFGMMTQQIGVEGTDTAKAGLIAALEVICVPIMMLILYKRKIFFVTWIFIITSMLGIMLLSVNSITGINRGDLIVFVSTLIYSYTIIQIPNRIAGLDPFLFSFFRMVFVAIMSAISAFIFERDLFSISAIYRSMPSVLYSGVLASGVAYTLQILGQRHCEPVIATLIMSLEGVFAAIFGWIILGQALSPIQIFGAVVAFVSIVVVQITDNRVRIS